MLKRLAVAVLATLFSTTSLAEGDRPDFQNLPGGIRTLQGLRFPPYRSLLLRPVTIGDLSLAKPSNISLETSKRVDELMQELKAICPDCATGGTVSGEAIVGPVNPGAGPPLFDDDICISRAEHTALVLKASKYDEIVSKK